MASKRVCIIGAGLAGLGSTKMCLDEGLTPICYEMRGTMGGLWKYSEEDIEGQSCVMRNTVFNSSKEMGSFSDLLIPEHYPNYLSHSQMFELVEDYVRHFKILPYIVFNTKTISVTQAFDYESTGRWVVETMDLKNNKEKKETFDCVIVCTGHHAAPLIPSFPGQNKFEGKITHSQSFKGNEEYKGKNVVVVGGGNSAIDMAVEISNVAKKTYVSVRSGLWNISRIGPWGIPIDSFYMTRFFNVIYNLIPYSLSNSLVENVINFKLDHSFFGLNPKHRFLDKEPTFNDGLGNKIANGNIIMKGDIEKFTKNGVTFVNDASEIPIDNVAMGTGYKIAFPFLKNVIEHEDNKVQLYKFVFPPEHLHPSLAFMGLFQVIGPGIPTGELQARWIARVFSGKIKLPPKQQRLNETKEFFETNYKRFGCNPNHTLHGDAINYMDDIASLIGCKPNLLKMFFQDPKLFYFCFFGGCLPYQYRLTGPNAWKGARDAILTHHARIGKPLNSTKYQPGNFIKHIVLFGIFIILSFILNYLF